jgi:hypothetical protein
MPLVRRMRSSTHPKSEALRGDETLVKAKVVSFDAKQARRPATV